MDQTTPNLGFGRFTKYIILGGIFGGLLSAIPILSCINCLFCLLNIAGIVFALSLYLKANPNDMLTNGESALFGLSAGAVAGVICGITNAIIGVLFGSALVEMLEGLVADLPEAASVYTSSYIEGMAAASFLSILLSTVLFAAFGALGTFLGMKLFFKARIRTSNP